MIFLELILVFISVVVVKRVLKVNRLSVLDLFLWAFSLHYIVSYVFYYFFVAYTDYEGIVYRFIGFSEKVLMGVVLAGIVVLSVQGAIKKFSMMHGGWKKHCVKIRYPHMFLLLVIVSLLLAFRFNTLAVGLEKTSLPFRLSGVIEFNVLLLVPLAVSYFFKGLYFRQFVLMALYSIFVLVFFGSKFYAFYPLFALIVIVLLEPLNNKSSFFRRHFVLICTIFVLAVYLILNPFYFRVTMAAGEEMSFLEMMYRSYLSANSGIYSFVERFLISLFNISSRLAGMEMMVYAIDVVEVQDSFLQNPHYIINSYFNAFGTGSTWAPGLLGYFVLFAGDLYVGLFFLLIFVCFYVLILYQVSLRYNYYTVALFFVLTFPWFIDGPIHGEVFLKIMYLCFVDMLFFDSSDITGDL